jgi:hexosaminidase
MMKILKWLLVITLVLLALGTATYFFYLRPAAPSISQADRAQLTLMPLPAKARLRQETMQTGSLLAVWDSYREERLEKAVNRINSILGGEGPDLPLRISCAGPSAPVQQHNEDESYELVIDDQEVYVKASNPLGVLRGLETLAQLAQEREGAHYVPRLKIEDRPRYPWRGLMIDVGRHFLPKESILRTLRLMAAVKLNVLHLHLSEYQGFRVESKVYPKLHELGSGSQYYSQADIREIVQAAREFGIRVVPEFDMPGHATSWLVGYPELGSAPGPYRIETKYGIFNPVIDPTREEVYRFLDTLIAEMSDLFPDPWFHIGGDEVAPHDWETNPEIVKFMQANGIADSHGLQHYFNRRVQKILASHGKKVMGWDEIIDPQLEPGVVIQAWRSQKALFEAVRQGRSAVLSNGWYLDHKLHAGQHYGVEPSRLPGAVTIEPDTMNWKQYQIGMNVSGSEIRMSMVLYGEGTSRRGLFDLGGQITGFENATATGDDLLFTFQSEFGEIDVEGSFMGDSVEGKMSLGILSFPFRGVQMGGNDMPGTRPPKVEKFAPLTPGEESLILGGEAAMWTELVDENNLDSRLWPRTAAIAERLWSSKELANDEEDMYRRLQATERHLINLGSTHETNYLKALQALGGSGGAEIVKQFVDVFEEVKYYDRLSFVPDIRTTDPLNSVADAARAESMEARMFNKVVADFLNDPTKAAAYPDIENLLTRLVTNSGDFIALAETNQRLSEVLPLVESLSRASEAALGLISDLRSGSSPDLGRVAAFSAYLDAAQQPKAGVMIAILPGLRAIEKSVRR